MSKEFGLTFIDGQPWMVALPDGGQSRNKAEQSEFAKMVNAAGKEAFHCEMASWCSNASSETRWDEEGEGFWWIESGYVTQRDGSKENWDLDREDYRGYGTGFRPVLIPVHPKTLQPDPSRLSFIEDGARVRLGTLYIDDYPLPNPTKPIGCGQPKNGMFGPFVGNIPRFNEKASLKIGDTASNPKQQITFIKVGDRLVADRVLIGCISISDLNEHLAVQKVAPERTSPEPDKPVTIWGRLGFSLQVTPEELKALRSDPKQAQETLLQLLSSDRCFIDGDTYFPGPSNEKYFDDDLEFDLPRRPLHAPSLPERSQEASQQTVPSSAKEACSKHISSIVKGDSILFEGHLYTAASDAYKIQTALGREWNVELAGDGPESYLYASAIPGGFVDVLPKQEKASLEHMIQNAASRADISHSSQAEHATEQNKDLEKGQR